MCSLQGVELVTTFVSFWKENETTFTIATGPLDTNTFSHLDYSFLVLYDWDISGYIEMIVGLLSFHIW